MNEAERAIIDGRLLNWARWSRESRRRGMSNLLPILQRLAMYGEYPADDETDRREQSRIDPIDVTDAQVVEAAILRMPTDTMTNKRARELLIALYTHPTMPVGRVYHALNIRRRSVDGLIGVAFASLATQLSRLESRFDPVKTSS